MDFKQFIHPEMPESHSPHLQSGKVIGCVRGQIVDLKDPEGLGRVRVSIDFVDKTSTISNNNEGFCTVPVEYTVNERLGGKHHLLEVGTHVAMIPFMGDMAELFLIGCIPNIYDKPDPNLNRANGTHGETTPGGVRIARDDKKAIEVQSFPHGAIKSVSADGDIQSATAGGARNQLSHTGDVRVESPKGFLQSTSDGQVTLANSSGSNTFLHPDGNVAMHSGFGSGVGLTEKKADYSGPLSEASNLLARCKRNISGNLAEAIKTLGKMEKALEKLELEQENPAALLSIFEILLGRIEDRLVKNFPIGVKDLTELGELTPEQMGRSIAGQVGEAYDLNLPAMSKAVDDLFDGAPATDKQIDDIRVEVGAILAAKVTKLFTYFSSRLKMAGGNVYSQPDLTRTQVDEKIAAAMAGNLGDGVGLFIRQILEGEPEQDFVMDALDRISRGDPQYDRFIHHAGKVCLPAIEAAFGVSGVQISDKGLELKAVLQALKPLSKDIAASIGVAESAILEQIAKGQPTGDFRAKLKEVLPPDLLENGIFPSPKLSRTLNETFGRMKFDPDRRREVLLSVALPNGYKSVQNILAMDLVNQIPTITKPWVFVRPGEVDSEKEKKKVVDAISTKQVALIDDAIASLKGCDELVSLIPPVRNILASTIRKDVENFDWSLEQVKSKIPHEEITIAKVANVLRGSCSPLLNHLPNLKSALSATQKVINCLPDSMPSAQLSISEASGALESGSRHNGGRIELSHAQSGMYAPNGRSAIFAQSEDMGMRMGKNNAFSIHAGEGAADSFSTLLNAGSIAMRNSDPKNKTSGLSMGRDGKLSMQSFPPLDEKPENIFDIYGDGTDWKGSTAEVAVAAGKMIAGTKSLDGAAQTLLELSGVGNSPTGKAVMGALKDGNMESLLELAGDAAGGAGSALLQILKDGKPESALELLNTPQGGGILQKIFSGGVLQSLTGNIGGMQMAMSFIKDPGSLFSLDGIMGIAETFAGATPQGMLALQGGKMIMKGLGGGGLEMGDTLKILGAAGGSLEVADVVKLAGMDVVKVIGEVMKRLDAIEAALP